MGDSHYRESALLHNERVREDGLMVNVLIDQCQVLSRSRLFVSCSLNSTTLLAFPRGLDHGICAESLP